MKLSLPLKIAPVGEPAPFKCKEAADSTVYDLEFYDMSGGLFSSVAWVDLDNHKAKSYREIHDFIINEALTKGGLGVAGELCRSIWSSGKNVWLRVTSEDRMPHLIFL